METTLNRRFVGAENSDVFRIPISDVVWITSSPEARGSRVDPIASGMMLLCMGQE